MGCEVQGQAWSLQLPHAPGEAQMPGAGVGGGLFQAQLGSLWVNPRLTTGRGQEALGRTRNPGGITARSRGPGGVLGPLSPGALGPA